MNQGARDENERRARQTEEYQRDQIVARIDRLILLMEMFMRHQGWEITRNTIVAPITVRSTEELPL